MPITSPGNDDDTGENHQPTLRKNTAEPAQQTLKQYTTVSRELRRGLWFASNENGSYRPYRPKRLKTGAWTSGPFYSALAAQRKADLRRRGSRKPRRMDSDRLRAWVLDSLRRGGARN